MMDWLNSRPRREQIYLLSLAIALVLWLVLQLAILPAADARQQMEVNNAAVAASLARVDAKVARLAALRAEGNSRRRSSLTASVSRVSEEAGLPVRRLSPNSRGEVQVRFEGVDYDALARWLHRVEGAEGLVIIDASIVQSGQAGGVNASFRLTESG